MSDAEMLKNLERMERDIKFRFELLRENLWEERNTILCGIKFMKDGILAEQEEMLIKQEKAQEQLKQVV